MANKRMILKYLDRKIGFFVHNTAILLQNFNFNIGFKVYLQFCRRKMAKIAKIVIITSTQECNCNFYAY
jgi:hypothetical protein